MNFKRNIKRLAIGVVAVLAIQTASYLTFAHRQLKDELMTEWLGALNKSADSVFVRDFYVTSCSVGDPWTYYSHNLAEKENEIKKRFGVKFVKFQDKKDFRWDNPEENEYKLVYYTWTKYLDPWTPGNLFHGLFTTTQIEYLRINNNIYYQKEVSLKWVLFFWVQTFEQIIVRTETTCQ